MKPINPYFNNKQQWRIKAKAFLFDLNGTMIDDMHYHAEGWFDILNNDLGASLHGKK